MGFSKLLSGMANNTVNQIIFVSRKLEENNQLSDQAII